MTIKSVPMYICVVHVDSFTHAQALRRMLEADGYPAAAVSGTFLGGPIHAVSTVCEIATYPESLSAVAGLYTTSLGGLDGLLDTRSRMMKPLVSIVEAERNALRNDLLDGLLGACDTVTASEPASPLHTGAGHDTGDEHDGGSSAAHEHDKFAPVNTCEDIARRARDHMPTDKYDTWTSPT